MKTAALSANLLRWLQNWQPIENLRTRVVHDVFGRNTGSEPWGTGIATPGPAPAEPGNTSPLYAAKLATTLDKLKDTEVVLDAPKPRTLAPFTRRALPVCGDNVLLIVPTNDSFKVDVLRKAVERAFPGRVIVRGVAAKSDVGAQPYNEAGLVGAHNRIENALDVFLDEEDGRSCLQENQVGMVLVASIENFIRLADKTGPAADCGAVAFYNATTHAATSAFSREVTVPEAYLAKARTFGFDGSPHHGNVTLGEVLAANVPGLNKSDWHVVVCGVSRYALLAEAVEKIAIPGAAA